MRGIGVQRLSTPGGEAVRTGASAVRAIDLRYLQRWNATRRKDPLAQMGVDDIYFGNQMEFITVASNGDRRAFVVRAGSQAKRSMSFPNQTE
jgi:hypothetical protein